MISIIIYLVIMAFIHSKMEIMIEGRQGWAHGLPCWRWNKKFWRNLLGGKPMTGYHFYMLVLFQIIFHIPFLFIDWTFNYELITQGLFCWYFVIEDTMWFISNPKYSFSHFIDRDVEWHRRWFYHLPVTYWWGMIIGTILILLGGK